MSNYPVAQWACNRKRQQHISDPIAKEVTCNLISLFTIEVYVYKINIYGCNQMKHYCICAEREK